MKNFGRWVLVVLAVGVAGYAFYGYFVLEPGSSVEPTMKAAYAAHPWRILPHVFFGAVALLVGPWQFIPSVRRRVRLHRALGYVYFGSVGVSGVAGLATAMIAYGGLVSQVGFGALAVGWLVASAAALRAVARRDFAAHEAWAIRSYALTFSAVTLRIYLGLFFAAGVAFETFYPLLAWLCWVPNVLVVEWGMLRRWRVGGPITTDR